MKYETLAVVKCRHPQKNGIGIDYALADLMRSWIRKKM